MFFLVCLQVIGVIDVNRSKEKGYGTMVKEGFCDEVKVLVSDFLYFWLFMACGYSRLAYLLYLLILFDLHHKHNLPIFFPQVYLDEIPLSNSILGEDRLSCFCEKVQCHMKQGSHQYIIVT